MLLGRQTTTRDVARPPTVFDGRGRVRRWTALLLAREAIVAPLAIRIGSLGALRRVLRNGSLICQQVQRRQRRSSTLCSGPTFRRWLTSYPLLVSRPARAYRRCLPCRVLLGVKFSSENAYTGSLCLSCFVTLRSGRRFVPRDGEAGLDGTSSRIAIRRTALLPSFSACSFTCSASLRATTSKRARSSFLILCWWPASTAYGNTGPHKAVAHTETAMINEKPMKMVCPPLLVWFSVRRTTIAIRDARDTRIDRPMTVFLVFDHLPLLFTISAWRSDSVSSAVGSPCFSFTVPRDPNALRRQSRRFAFP